MWVFREKIALGAFTFAVIIVAGLSFLSYRTTHELLGAEGWIFHTYEVIESLDSLLDDVTRAESAGRGFILSGNQAYVSDYSAVRAQIEPEIQNIEKLTGSGHSRISKRNWPKNSPSWTQSIFGRAMISKAHSDSWTRGKDVARWTIFDKKSNV
jgi:hypothetical protein